MITGSKSFSDSMRVTSIRFKNSNYVIFMGIPIRRDSYKINSGKYNISIKTKLSTLPIDPSTKLPIELSIGQIWQFTGKRYIQPVEVGDFMMSQHVYESPDVLTCALPESGESLIQFIAKEKDFKGIGESKARALWDCLGKQFHATLRKDTEESRGRIKNAGLSNEAIDSLFLGYAKYANLSHYKWMSEHGIPPLVQQRLLRFHGEKSIDAIKGNPYLLSGFGMTFEKIDELAKSKFDVELNDHRRLSSALEMSIRKEVEKNHTYTNHTHIQPHLRALLGDNELVTQAFKAGYDKAQYILNAETGNYHPTPQFLMESVVARRLLKLATQKNLYNNEAEAAYSSCATELPYTLLEKQIEAILATLDNAVSCITGGAGTGKTAVLRTALRAYMKLGFEIHAVALSGRAAMRLHESIGINTLTIAAFLNRDAIEPSGKRTKHLLVIDEASMVDLPTMYRLVTKIHPSVRIIFTGDPDQLPPIGCGKVLADIVESKAIVNTKLDIVKRSEASTGIPEYSEKINQGTVPEKLSTGNIHFHETAEGDIASVCTDLYRQSSHNSRILAGTTVMVKDINKLTQNRHNPNGELMRFEMSGELVYLKLLLNDAVLFTQNNYDKGIQNGSLGKLISVDQTENGFGVVKLDTGEKVNITKSLLDCMELGYSITLHKAQGSQFPRIIIAFQKGRIVDRAWLYTAITRAETEIHIVGSAADFAQVTKSPSNAYNRRSNLALLLSP